MQNIFNIDLYIKLGLMRSIKEYLWIGESRKRCTQNVVQRHTRKKKQGN